MRLQVCALFANKLSGPLPDAWSALIALEHMLLPQNALTGVPQDSACPVQQWCAHLSQRMQPIHHHLPALGDNTLQIRARVHLP
jgi:hypothetical protein